MVPKLSRGRAVSLPRVKDSYVELPPRRELSGAVRAIWVQAIGDAPYVQRHLPTGGMEVHFPVGGVPRLVGPLTGPLVEVMAPGSTLVGVRFLPGAAPPFWDAAEVLDHRIELAEVWTGLADRLGDVVASASDPWTALERVQDHLTVACAAAGTDRVVRATVRRLMPWLPASMASIADDLAISPAQLRRRCLHTLGVTPKVLQRTLRLQGFLALAQARAAPTTRRNAAGLSGLAADVGYADQAHQIGRASCREECRSRWSPYH